MKKYCNSNTYIFICSKKFRIITFFRVSYNLTGKWNLDIDFFQVLTYCNFPSFGLIEKCYQDNK